MHKKTLFASIALVATIGTFAAQQRFVSNQPIPVGLHDVGHIENIVDGGTLIISYDDGKQTLTGRLAHVDSPTLTDPAGPEAQQSLDQLASGRTVAFTVESYDKDNTPRLAVELDGIDVATEQLRRGWGRLKGSASLKGSANRAMVDAELIARHEHAGIWSLTVATN